VVFRNRTNAQFRDLGASGSFGLVNIPGVWVPGSGTNNLRHYSTAANSIEIWINYDHMLAQINAQHRPTVFDYIARHELGHVIGLRDLPHRSSNCNIMCNGIGVSAANFHSTITEQDRRGASVILGQHNHDWRISLGKFTRPNGKVVNTHRIFCNICQGTQGTQTTHTICTYGGNGRCTVSACQRFRNGDVNQDGTITVADAIEIFSHLAGNPLLNAERQHLADVNGDGQVTIVDAQEILNFAAGMDSVIERP
jgi:hypothetical protein